MNINNLKKSLEFTLKWEGGYSNDPKDPGGETKWGISKRAHPNLDIRNLTPEQALEVYTNDYWLPAGCDELLFPLCTAVFDTAVNLGVSRIRTWDRGEWGAFLAMRQEYYVQLVRARPSLQRYFKGWLNRVNDLKKFCEINSV